jgi:hypothetical protein
MEPETQASGGDENLVVPENLTSLTDGDLETLGSELLRTFDAIRSEGALSADKVTELRTITAAIERVNVETKRRDEENEALAAEAAELDAQLQSMGVRVETAAVEVPEPEPAPEPEPEVVPEPVPVTASAGAGQTRTGALVVKRKRLNVPLSEVARRAPDPGIGLNYPTAQVVTAPDVPMYAAGRQLETLDYLTDAVHRRANTLAMPSGYTTVATIRKEYPLVLDRETAPEQIWDVMHRAADPQNLVAAGGWCAPSTIIYDFFNIACGDGIIDVPTVGVTRGGIRWPTSPTIADALDDIWLWTEGDDILAVTGAGTKPCVRVPCPSFNELRLACHGLCITAGNLTESAYPEMISNYLRLVMNAHEHIMNQRIIADIVAGSTSVTVTGTDVPLASGLLGAIGLQAADYRERFRMCDNEILEVVLPRWAKEAIRSDLAKRTGVENMMAVTDAQMNAWFDARYVRVQYVSDWQLGSGDQLGQITPRTQWPNFVQFLIYAAGTWVVGMGLDLNLGVVRDSALNAKNDHTAAWTEECKLTAMIGHQSRLVTLDFCASGMTGAASLTCANTGP